MMPHTRIGLMFAGQGAQIPGMGADLYQAIPEAKQIFDQADDILGRSISNLCFHATLEELTLCSNCQPAIFTMSMACLAALKTRIPDCQIAICGGLSLGEYAALCAAGVFNFETALRLVNQRGLLMDEACRENHGSMAAILKQDEKTVADLCSKWDVDIANYNCPGQLIISGPKNRVSQAVADATAAGMMAKTLTVAGAYHSRLMEPASEKFAPFVQNSILAAPQTAIVQNYTGKKENNPAAIAENLIRQISGSVRWEACARSMMNECDCLLELGPGKVLCGLAKRIDRAFPAMNVCDLDTISALVPNA